MNQYYPNQFQPSNRLQFPAYQPPIQQTEQLHWVENQAQAEAYMVGAGNTVTLWDSKQNRIYVKSTNEQGIPVPMAIYEYKDITNDVAKESTGNNYVTADQIEELVSKAIDRHYEKRREERAAKRGESNE